MKIEIDLPFTDEEFQSACSAAAQGKASPLRSLCQKEVQRFEGVMRSVPDYQDGLVRIERLAVEGYLYQKLRGHISNEKEGQGGLHERRRHGTP